jgi:hypothetical protein
MREEEILQKSIEKAINNGWNKRVCCGDNKCNMFIFSHSFAKAFWGEALLCDEEINLHTEDECRCEYPNPTPAWIKHLQHMVLQDNPIRYLELFINPTNKE